MQLSSVTIKNFRALVDVTVELDETTVLIGENNTGKTSFLDALKICLGQSSQRRENAFNDYDHHLGSDDAQIGDAGDTEVTLLFAESVAGEWPAEVIQATNDVITLVGEMQQLRLRVRSSKDATTGEQAVTWEFLNPEGDVLRPKRPENSILGDLKKLKPLYYLSAVRDATREFQPGSPYWGTFLRNPTMSDEVRKDLEEQLDSLNAKVIAADHKLRDVKSRLEKTAGIVSIQATDAVTIEAVPGRARDLLSSAQVSVSGRSGARLPMARHGAGTQSLSVLFLFESFLNSRLSAPKGEGSVPIVAIEEPEAHLHPAAARALWKAITDIPGQKLVATHSGDLLARVPLENLRRFCYDGAGIRICRLEPETLNKDELRKMGLHIRATRGELLFARSWLLVEGATEVWLFEGIAEVLGVDLEREGVRIVQYAQVMPEPFIKLADDLGIGWFVFSDGDTGGQDKTKGVPALFNGRTGAEHFHLLSELNVEVHLCAAGFGNVYLRHIASQKASSITAVHGESKYWEQVVAATPKRGKEARVIEVVEEMRSRGVAAVPHLLNHILKQVIQLAGGRSGP